MHITRGLFTSWIVSIQDDKTLALPKALARLWPAGPAISTTEDGAGAQNRLPLSDNAQQGGTRRARGATREAATRLAKFGNGEAMNKSSNLRVDRGVGAI